MKRKKHSETEAIATCSKCGSGVCTRCAEISVPVESHYGVMCPDYCRGVCHDIVGQLKKATLL